MIVAIPASFVWELMPDRWTNAMKYGVIYHVDISQVYTDPKPIDREWDFAL